MNRSWGRRVFEVLSPLIIYEGLCIVVQTMISAGWAMGRAEEFLTQAGALNQKALMDALLQFTYRYGVLMQGIAALISIVILYRMYLKDYPKRRFVYDRSGITLPMWALLIPVGIVASFSANLFINIGSWALESEAFQNSEALLFSGPAALQLLFIGLVIPVCEELIFRGLIYMRMRQYANVNSAIMVQALIFALMHGNMAQGIYAFILGVLLAYVFEKYGSLKAPVLVHVSANLLSVVMGLSVQDAPLFSNEAFLAAGGCIACAAAFLLVFILDKRVDAPRIYLDQITGKEDTKDTGSGAYQNKGR